MDNQEIVARFGADTSAFDRSLRKMQSGLAGASEEGHKGFLHVGSAGRGFHHLIEKITESSPLMGSALKFAISPVVGVLGVATLAFTYFHDKIKEFNAEMDKIGDNAAKPVLDMAKAAREGREKLKEFNREFDKWLLSHVQGDQITKHLAEQLELLKLQSNEIKKITGHEMERETLQAQLALQTGAKKKLEKATTEERKEVDFWKDTNSARLVNPRMSKAQQEEADSEEKIKELRADLHEFEKKGDTMGVTFGDFMRGLITNPAGQFSGMETLYPVLPSASKDLAEKIVKTTAELERYKENLKKAREAVEDEKDTRKQIADHLKSHQSRYDELSNQLRSVSDSERATRQALGVLPPDVSPTGGNASLMATANWIAQHRTSLDKWDQYGAKGINDFKDRLNMKDNPINAVRVKTGEDYLKESAEHLKELRRLANPSGPGLNVLPHMGE